jgi:hypothetical protein
MISKELEQLERTAEEQRLLRIDRDERRQREYTRKKLTLRRKIEEVRGEKKCCEVKEKKCVQFPQWQTILNVLCCLETFQF